MKHIIFLHYVSVSYCFVLCRRRSGLHYYLHKYNNFAGNTSQSFNVFLYDDNIHETSEQFEVIIKTIHPIGEQQPIPLVVLGAITVAYGTILDDDGKLATCF